MDFVLYPCICCVIHSINADISPYGKKSSYMLSPHSTKKQKPVDEENGIKTRTLRFSFEKRTWL